MNRQIGWKEIQKAQETYLSQSKPFIDRISQLQQLLIPRIIQTETEVKVFYEETKEMVLLKKHLEEISNQIKEDLENGKFL